ncbi:MAG: pyrroline-5-carboxylate reductase, partial [Alphaproteobacteria bacterium]
VGGNRWGEALLISIAAGVPLAALESTGCRAARAMPNLAAEIGRGITALAAGRGVDERCMEMARALFSAVGETVTLADEKLLDAVTAVSGSGPAYVFAFTQALEAAACREGLPAEVAARLARATVVGAAALMEARPDDPPACLREEVTSPGGTTAAALAVFGHNSALRTLMEEAVRAAHRRAVELGREVAAGLRTGKPGEEDDGREDEKPGNGLGKGPPPDNGRDE